VTRAHIRVKERPVGRLALYAGFALVCSLAAAIYVRKAPAIVRPVLQTGTRAEPMRRLVENIGDVAPQSQTTRSVAIENNSSFTWTVSGVTTNCGCIVHRIEPQVIAAGLAGTLTFSFKASSNPGTIHRSIFVAFREPNTPTVSIDITGFVRTWCYSPDESVNFGVVVVGGDEKPPVRNVLLRLAPGKSLSTRPPTTPAWLTASCLRNGVDDTANVRDGEAITVRLVPCFSGEAAPGAFAGDVTFQSSADPPEEFHLPVRASVRSFSALEAKPDRLFLGTRRAGDRFSTKITIRGKSLPPRLGATYLEERIRVTHDLGDQLVIKSTPGDEPARFHLECHFTMPTKPCFLTGTIKVRVEGHESIAVPVSAKVIGPS
jgi:hypothetical protein